VAAQQRQVDSGQRAQDAAGIGETDGEDHESEDRDADGRRLWEDSHAAEKGQGGEADSEPGHAPRSKDATGNSGNLLDLSG
jgi:hypothetical protein